MLALFSVTLCLSAFLLFAIEPWVGRLLLPLLGGVPSVWITCLLFFQVLLLGGYAYAHGLTRRCAWRRQVAIHLGLLALALVCLPPALPSSLVRWLEEGASPLGWLALTLLAVIGLPFFALSATTPLLLRWYAHSDRPDAQDPHFLFAASNLGSLGALGAYPLLVEPNLALQAQSMTWAWGYGGAAVLVALCAWAVARRFRPEGALPGTEVAPAAPPDLATRARWVGLAFVASAAVMSVTQHITTDLAGLPLFWVVPLGLYLLTFVLAFGRVQVLPVKWASRFLPPSAAAVVFLLLVRAMEPLWVILLLNLLFLFVTGMLCHGRLAESRPGPAGVTVFYLCLSLGGVLGGVFTALLAPLLFTSVYEFPITIALACLCRPSRSVPSLPRRLLDFAFPVLLGAMTAALMVMARSGGWESVAWRNAGAVGLPLVLGFAFVDRRLRYALGLAAVLLAGWNYERPGGRVLREERSFFGVTRVTESTDHVFRFLVHGSTLHGRQFIEPARECEPLAYYHVSGPVGELFEVLADRRPRGRVAVVGLGTGAMAGHARPGQTWTFYEIDPKVLRIATDTNCFTYLGRCTSVPWRVVEGDARLRLRSAPPGAYDFIAVDAFSSDAIPVHLLTREAVALYLSKLAAGGFLAFHISNRYVDLEPVLAEVATAMGLVSRTWDDWDLDEELEAEGKETSQWVVLARRESDLGELARRVHWVLLERRRPPLRVWTDDYSALLQLFDWD